MPIRAWQRFLSLELMPHQSPAVTARGFIGLRGRGAVAALLKKTYELLAVDKIDRSRLGVLFGYRSEFFGCEKKSTIRIAEHYSVVYAPDSRDAGRGSFE